jgi:hypothetical protein
MAVTEAGYTDAKLTEYAQRLILRGALDAEVMDRAAMILKLRSSKPDAISIRAMRKVLTRQAARIREERAARPERPCGTNCDC